MHRVTCHDGFWVSSEVKLATDDADHAQQLLSVQGFSAYMVVRGQSVDLVDLNSSAVMHTFTTEPMQARSLKFTYSGQKTGHGGKGTVSSLTLAYNDDGAGDCILQTYLPDEKYDNIWFSDATGPPARTSCTWKETKQITRRIDNPGNWTPTRNGSIVGVRRKQHHAQGSPVRARLPAFAQSGLRRRGQAAPTSPSSIPTESWETWVITKLEQEGTIETKPLIAPEDPTGLIISKLGPMTKVGYGSVAVGFGNVLKIITVGHEWFDAAGEEGLKADSVITSRRRRHPASRTRTFSATFRRPGVT